MTMTRTGLIGLLLTAAFTFVAVRDSDAQSTRIKFRRGSVSATASGNLNSFRSKRVYVIRVREGQTLRTEQVGGGSRPITIFVKDPNGEGVGDSDASCNNRREISPTEAGDYIIEVVECRKADPWRGRFTFRVTVR
jgi:hypothetical protein